jgi:hypothetical protein
MYDADGIYGKIEVDNISGCLHCLAKNDADKLAIVENRWIKQQMISRTHILYSSHSNSWSRIDILAEIPPCGRWLPLLVQFGRRGARV